MRIKSSDPKCCDTDSTVTNVTIGFVCSSTKCLCRVVDIATLKLFTNVNLSIEIEFST
jgi:hypothetical protein